MTKLAFRQGFVLSVACVAAIYGCKAPSPAVSAMTPHAAAQKAKVAVDYGNVALRPDADMVVRFKLTDLKSSKYKLQSLSGVDHVTIQVTDSASAVHTATVLASQIIAGGGNEAIASFSGLPLGAATVSITAYDALNTVLYGPQTYGVTINEGQVAVVHATCEVGTGSLLVDFTCEDMCASGAGSPLPTPTATDDGSPGPSPDACGVTPSPQPSSLYHPALTFVDATSDEMDNTTYGANGFNDGHFRVTVTVPANTTIDRLMLYVGSGIWDTQNEGPALLGVFQSGTPVMSGYGGPIGTFSGTVTFDLYANNFALEYFNYCDPAWVTMQVDGVDSYSPVIDLP